MNTDTILMTATEESKYISPYKFSVKNNQNRSVRLSFHFKILSSSRRSSHLSFNKDNTILVFFHHGGEISIPLMHLYSTHRFSSQYSSIILISLYPQHTVIKKYRSIVSLEMSQIMKMNVVLLKQQILT